ncbi:hypothetical protein M3223_14070 [Paenibacillus pasadenensis]|uniref:hypothetical protein n=1 Tax=Paenibacillus pasadenensis TaxID=217090 RepID=UPI00203D1D5A|nr:hypothetical protein [Paenibacillus pasadenensis]MCM3748474.1 hypothetical protein [Paenibacillus pasadenensis]
MKKAFKWLAGLLLALVLLLGGAFAGAIWYIRPQQELTLEHAPLDLGAKGMNMVRSGKAELFLSGEDINNLARAHLKGQPQVTPDFRIEGAQLDLQGNRMTADINGRIRGQIAVGVQAEYELEWSDPNLIATPVSVKLRGIQLPSTLLERMVIPVGDKLPPLVGIKSVQFRDGGVAVALQLQP